MARLAQLEDAPFATPAVLHEGGSLSIANALALLGEYGHHGAQDPVEGAVWRVEKAFGPRDHRTWEVAFLAKYVRPNKEDGCYLPEITSHPELWNWTWANWHAEERG